MFGNLCSKKSEILLLRHLKVVKSGNCSEKTSEWFTEDAKCSFENSAEKHFAKSQNVFCSKSWNVIKEVSFGIFHSHQNKLLFRYVEGSFDNRAEFSPSKARISFWLISKKDRKCKEFFSKTIFRSKNSSVHEECSFEKTLPKFLRWKSQHLLLISRKDSNYEKCSENVLKGDAKCSFDNNAEKTSQEVQKFLALNPELIKNKIFFHRNLIHYKLIICTNGIRFWQTYQNFSKSSESLMLESQKKHEKFCFNREYFNLKMTLCACRSQFWQPYWIIYSAKSLFFMPKVKNYEKVKKIFANTSFSSKNSSVQIDGSLTNFSKFYPAKVQTFVAQIPKGC